MRNGRRNSCTGELVSVTEGICIHLLFAVVGFKVGLVLEQLEGLKEGYRNSSSRADKPVIPEFGFL